MLSIVVPCFNAAATIREALDSALAQEGELEVVAVDDGSHDDTLQVLRSYGTAIRVLSGPNRGVSAARNWGLEEAAGDWIVFLDADDLLEPGAPAAQRKAAARAGADVVFSGWSELAQRPDGQWRRGVTRFVDMAAIQADAQLVFAREVLPPPGAILYRRSLAQAVGGFRPDLPVVQDVRFLFDCARRGARFAGIDQVGALYRVVPTSVSRRSVRAFWTDVARNASDIERCWQADHALSPARLAALTDIYNNAVKQLCRQDDPGYAQPLEALKRLQLPIWRRNRALGLLARTCGVRAAGRAARLWGEAA
ncbi:MAG TPA: glycosyltransferase [Phenylobacterium sp.]|uniref:glycosyltransferase family 2 protein n=1 Tax=Phenylobacterium sp. TaxID=1871053 RepID=UPI002B48DA86|nr:glycosyltransferase [Phenylobacterium sp.]HKR90507.1 glycosyltransferase [Phenylobacterium sp.]